MLRFVNPYATIYFMGSAQNLQPSIYQSKIFDYIQNAKPPSPALLIQAVAGSGKSTTLEMLVSKIRSGQDIVYLAFAKKNVDDMLPRLKGQATVSTFNSLGFRAWNRFINLQHGQRLELSSDLNYIFLREFLVDNRLTREVKERIISDDILGYGNDPAYAKSLQIEFDGIEGDISRLTALAKAYGIVPQRSIDKRPYRWLLQDTLENWRGIISAHDLSIERVDVAIELCRSILEKSIERADEIIDFDSQLWLPVIHNAPFPKFDWILLDEAQDLSSIQLCIAEQLLKEKSRLVVAGDRFQSIYAFRGALCNSMDLIRDKFSAHELPLSICYRCSKSVVKYAKRYVDQIEHHEAQVSGNVFEVQEYDHTVFGKHDAILCRYNRPLISLAYSLIKAKVPCRILGRDLETGLVRLVKKIKASSVDDLIEKLEVYGKREAAKFAKRGDSQRIQGLNDRLDTLNVFINELPESNRTISKLTDSINHLFKRGRGEDNRAMVTLSTVHKVKGAEYENVWIINHGAASKASTEDAKQQEKNIKYVAVTRAKKNLYFIGDKGFCVDKIPKIEYKPVDLEVPVEAI